MLREHSAILLTFIKLSFVIKIFVLSIFEWLLKTGFTVFINTVDSKAARKTVQILIRWLRLHCFLKRISGFSRAGINNLIIIVI